MGSDMCIRDRSVGSSGETLVFRLTVTDNDGATNTDDVSIAVSDTATPALVVGPLLLSIREGEASSFGVRLNSQPTGDVVVAISESDVDISLNVTSLTFTTSNWDTNQFVRVTAESDPDTMADTATITVSASGGGFGAAANVEVSVNITDTTTPSEPLSLPDPSDFSVQIGTAINRQFPAASGGTGSYTYSMVGLDTAGLSFSPSARRLSGTVTIGTTVGVDTVQYRVSDGTTTVNQSFTITRTAPPAPTLPDPPNRIVVIGDTVNWLLPAASGGSGNYAYSVSSLDTGGLSFSPSTRRITGTVSGTGGGSTDTVTYSVNDGYNTVSQSFVITRNSPPTPPTSPRNLSISWTGLSGGRYGYRFSYSAPSSWGTGSTRQYVVTGRNNDESITFIDGLSRSSTVLSASTTSAWLGDSLTFSVLARTEDGDSSPVSITTRVASS